MKDDFFNQFQESPRPEFAAELYERIHRPMKTETVHLGIRRLAMAFALLCILLGASLVFSPALRAQAQAWLRQIGVFTLTTEQPPAFLPTALPPEPSTLPTHYATALAAGKAAGFKVLEPGMLPQGYLQHGDYTLSTLQHGLLVASIYTQSGGPGFILFNQYQPGTGDAFTDNLSPAEQLQDVNVRGSSGVWITGRLMTDPTISDPSPSPDLKATQWLRWEEQGVTYTLISNDLSLDEVLQLVNSLH